MTKYFITVLLLLTLFVRGQKDSLGIVFNKMKATINQSCSRLDKVDSLIKILKDNPTWVVELAINTKEYEAGAKTIQKINSDRLEIMKDLVVQKGIHESRLLIRFGEQFKIVSDKDIKEVKKVKSKKLTECEYMKANSWTFWRLLSKDYIDPNKK